MMEVQDIREWFKSLYKNKIFVQDKSGVKTIEILGAQFVANDTTIFGKVDDDYIRREMDWYKNQSLSVFDMEPPIPSIWKEVANKDGNINSNYGFLLLSKKNGSQLENVIQELVRNPWSRRAIAIYTRPTMWSEYNKDGMSDFICTNTVQYFIRENPDEPKIPRLFAYVNMRSNDAWAGYRNDYAWQRYVFDQIFFELRNINSKLARGAIVWNVGSLHIYERQFYLLDHYIVTGNHEPTRKEINNFRDSTTPRVD